MAARWPVGVLFSRPLNTVLFWGLIILGVIALFRYLNRGDRSTMARSTPEQVLAERFARGEIDEQEYERRLATLRRLGPS